MAMRVLTMTVVMMASIRVVVTTAIVVMPVDISVFMGVSMLVTMRGH